MARTLIVSASPNVSAVQVPTPARPSVSVGAIGLPVAASVVTYGPQGAPGPAGSTGPTGPSGDYGAIRYDEVSATPFSFAPGVARSD